MSSRTSLRAAARLPRARPVAARCASGSSSAPSTSHQAKASATSDTSAADPHTSSASSFEPILPKGVSHAYDTALSFLHSHSESRLVALRALESRISSTKPSQAQLKRLQEKQVSAHINDPAVNKRFRQTRGVGEMHNPVMRHLAERRWAKHGGLDLIMGRVYDNRVVPDLLSDIGPTQPLTLVLSAGQQVEPGFTLPPSNLEHPPHLTFQPFHHPGQIPAPGDTPPTALFTLLCVDPDSPDYETHSFSNRLHYMKTDIPLSILSGETPLISSEGGNELLSWEPPAPPKGSDRHRYVFLLVQQRLPSAISSTPSRSKFDFRRHLADNGLHSRHVVGVNLFRCVWSEEEDVFINRVWREWRSAPKAPEYGDAPKEEKYGYPLTSLQRRAEGLRQQAWEKTLREVGVQGVEELLGTEQIGEARRKVQT